MPKQPLKSDSLGPRRPFKIGEAVHVRSNGAGAFDGVVVRYVDDFMVTINRSRDPRRTDLVSVSNAFVEKK